jgi:cytochrome c-type biogenesis protein
MVLELFTWLSNSLQASPGIALTGSFLWGVASIILSPCHLASIPLIVGFIGSQGRTTTKRAFFLALLFSLGILVTIGLIGIITGVLGRMLNDVNRSGNYFVAVIFFVVGLYLWGILPLPFLNKAAAPSYQRKGYLAAFILGLVFGIALGPCTFAYMMPMLGVVFKVASTQFVFAVLLILAYAMGHCGVIVTAGTMTELVQKYLNWNEQSGALNVVKKICGALVILAGVYLIWSK